MKSKNSIYCLLVLVLLLGIATLTDLLVYTTYGQEFFMTALFVLVTFLVLSIFLFSSTLGSLFSLGIFSITLLTGLFSFQRLFPEQLWLLALLLVIGIFGFIGTLLTCTLSRSCKRKKCTNETYNSEVKPTSAPAAMEFPFKPKKKQKESDDVSTYDIETPEMQSLALMESLGAMKNAEKETLDGDEFVELDDIEKMMTSKRPVAKKANGKKKSKK